MGFQDDCVILSALFNVLYLKVHVLFESKVVSLCLSHFSKLFVPLFTISLILHVLLFSPMKIEMHLVL